MGHLLMLQLFLYISHQLLNFCLDFLSNSKNAQKFKCCRKPCWSMTYLGLSFLKSLRIFNFFSELLRLHMNQRPPFQFRGRQPSLPRITSIKFRHLSSRPINSSSLNSSLRDNILRYVFKSLLVFICLH